MGAWRSESAALDVIIDGWIAHVHIYIYIYIYIYIIVYVCVFVT